MTKILVVDDEPGVLEQAKLFLERNKELNVETANSASKALFYIKENSFDAVVSDYKMPEMDGLELLKKLRDDGNDIPFILLTGKGEEEVAMKALNLGVNRYMIKGRDPKEQYGMLAQTLMQEVELWRSKLEQQRMQKELRESEEKHRTVFEASGTAMVMIEEDGTISLANKGFESMSGYSTKELTNKKQWIHFVDEIDRERVNKFLALGRIDNDLPPRSFVMTFTDKFTQKKNVYVSLSWVKDTDRCIASILDFTGFESPLEELKELHTAILSEDVEMMEKHLSNMISQIFEQDTFRKRIKDWCLEEIFILLIAARNGANGKELGEDLTRLFNISLSTSIVYPLLHEMEESGILRKQEHIRTKEYLLRNKKESMNIVNDKVKQLFGMYSTLKLLSIHAETADDNSS